MSKSSDKSKEPSAIRANQEPPELQLLRALDHGAKIDTLVDEMRASIPQDKKDRMAAVFKAELYRELEEDGLLEDWLSMKAESRKTEDITADYPNHAVDTDAPPRDSSAPDRLVSFLPRRLVSENWTSPTAVITQDQRLAAFSGAGYRGWLSFVIKFDDDNVARLKVLFRNDGRVHVVREDSGDSIIGVFDADGLKVGELKKADDEALVFLGGSQLTEANLVDHLKIKLLDR